MDAKPSSGFRAEGPIWPYRLAIFLLPVLVLWHQDNSLFTPPGFLDPWLYLGFFRNLVNFKRDLFPNTYYGSRLGWILSGWFAHTLFPPVIASAALHLGVLWTALFSLFETLRLAVGRRSAFLTTLVFSANPQLWYAIGWNYVDGSGVACCLLTLALFTCAAWKPGRRWILPLAGVAIAGLVYSNLVLTSFVPLLVLYYAALAWTSRRPSWRNLFLDVALFTGGGFLLATLFLCIVNHVLDGRYWFYAPSFRAVTQLSHKEHPETLAWQHPGLVPWLWFTALGAASAVAQIITRLRRPITPSGAAALMFSGQLLVFLALFTYLQSGHFNALGQPFYAVYLLPFAFLVIGASFWRGAEHMSPTAYLFCCGLAAVLLGVAWYDYSGSWTPSWPSAVFPVAALGTAAFAAAVLVPHRTLAALLAIVGFALFTAEVRTGRKSTPMGEAALPSGPHMNRQTLEQLMQTRSRIESLRQNRPVRFWYDPDEPPAYAYLALNATYLMSTFGGNLPFPQLACDTAIQPETLVVISSVSGQKADTARNALAACASRAQLRTEPVGSMVTNHPAGAYTTVFLALERDPSNWRNIRPAFDASGKASLELMNYAEPAPAFPPALWWPLEPKLGTTLRIAAEGVELITPKIAKAGAAAYGPLVAPASGRYTFTIRYRSRSELFAFGVRAADGVKWLVTDVTPEPSGLDRERTCQVDLEAGQEFRIEIANNHRENSPASLVIRKLTGLMVNRN